MTHDELYAKIRTGNEFLGVKYAPDSHTFALRAVVELHKPFDFTMGGEPYLGCNCGQEYPCPTIQAIERELG